MFAIGILRSLESAFVLNSISFFHIVTYSPLCVVAGNTMAVTTEEIELGHVEEQGQEETITDTVVIEVEDSENTTGDMKGQIIDLQANVEDGQGNAFYAPKLKLSCYY